MNAPAFALDDVFAKPGEPPFALDRWDLAAVAFSDDPLRLVFERVSTHLGVLGYVPGEPVPAEPATSARDELRFVRGSQQGSLQARHVLEMRVEVVVERVRVGVYRIQYRVGIDDQRVNGSEREYRRAEREALVIAIEDLRTPYPIEFLRRLAEEADGQLKAIRSDQVGVKVLVVGGILGIMLLMRLRGSWFMLPIVLIGWRAIAAYQDRKSERLRGTEEPKRRMPPGHEVLSRAISAVGYWRAWASDGAARFNVLFSNVQLWAPREAPDQLPIGALALCFGHPEYVAFFTRKRADGTAADAWPDGLASGSLGGIPVSLHGVWFVSRLRALQEMADCVVRPVIGQALPPHRGDREIFLLNAGACGLVVAGGEVSFHTTMGEVTLDGVLALRYRWELYWKRYWHHRVQGLEFPYDPTCELEVPMDPDLADWSSFELVLAGGSGR